MPFRIKMKKGYAKNDCVYHQGNIAEVQNQMESIMISKNTGDMAGASKITYALIWQFSNTEK